MNNNRNREEWYELRELIHEDTSETINELENHMKRFNRYMLVKNIGGLKRDINRSNNLIIMMLVLLMSVIITSTSIIMVLIHNNETLVVDNSELINSINSLQTTISQLDSKLSNMEMMLTDVKNQVYTNTELLNMYMNDLREDDNPGFELNVDAFSQPCGLSIEQLNEVIRITLDSKGKFNSVLYNNGESLYSVERSCGINAFLLLGISGLGSGWGESAYAINRNNVYGFVGETFDSLYDCHYYAGILLHNSYISEGLDTIELIQSKFYPTNTKWGSDVEWIMNQYIKTAKDLYVGN